MHERGVNKAMHTCPHTFPRPAITKELGGQALVVSRSSGEVICQKSMFNEPIWNTSKKIEI